MRGAALKVPSVNTTCTDDIPNTSRVQIRVGGKDYNLVVLVGCLRQPFVTSRQAKRFLISYSPSEACAVISHATVVYCKHTIADNLGTLYLSQNIISHVNSIYVINHTQNVDVHVVF